MCLFYAYVYVFYDFTFFLSVLCLLFCKHVRLACVFFNKLTYLYIIHVLCIAGTGADIRSECLRKLSSHTPLFAVGDVAGVGLNPGSEISIESNAQLFGIPPFYVPRGSVFMLV